MRCFGRRSPRVLSEHSITTALGSRSGASKRKKHSATVAGSPVPIFVAPQQLEPFIPPELAEALRNPIRYRVKNRAVQQLLGELSFPEICDVWLRAREVPNALQDQQLERAHKAEILMRGLASVGIIALVDQATGYQEERARDELHRILEANMSKELLPWTKRFPDEFYKEMFRTLELDLAAKSRAR